MAFSRSARLALAGVVLLLPLATAGADAPAASVTPATSVTPIVPVTPITPATPVTTVLPVTPVTPVTTTTPVTTITTGATATPEAAATAATVASLLTGAGLTAASTTVLTLFLIAVLLESALAVLFNWRPFIETFNARATRPLVAFVVAMLVVRSFGYDAMTALMDAVQGKTTLSPAGTLGQVVTAAILAGGSAGVNTMLVALGFREVKTPATIAPQVSPQHAWIAVRVIRKQSTGEVRVQIGKPDPTAPDDLTKLPLAGVITETSPSSVSALKKFFLREKGRFPGYGGHEVPALEPCQIVLSAKAATATGDLTVVPIPKGFVPAPGAIIDLTVTL